MEALMQDLRYAMRSLRRSRWFAVAAVLTLAVAIGANTAVFSVVNGVLLRPLPFPQQDRLLFLYEQDRAGHVRPASYPQFLDWEAQNQAFSGLGYVRGRGTALRGADGSSMLTAAFVSPGFFPTLGERPMLGRLFSDDEARNGGRVAVLSNDLWRSRFGGDPRILGKTLSLSDGVFTVVGVLPRDVTYPTWAQLYLPVTAIAATERALSQRGLHADSRVIGRLRPGITPTQATAELGLVEQRLAAAYPALNRDWTTIGQFPVRNEILGDAGPQILLLMAAVALALLIACVSVTNLSLARAAARRREWSIRAALGAGHGRMARQLLTESALVAALGGILGVLLAVWLVALLRQMVPDAIPRWETVGINGWVLTFTAGITLAVTVAVGSAPAILSTRSDPVAGLKEGVAGGGVRHQRLRASLVGAEIGLAVVLVVGAGLLARSFWHLHEVNPGFDPEHLIAMRISPPPLQADPAQATAFYGRLLEALAEVPGVAGVALTNHLPLSGAAMPATVEVPGYAPDPEHNPEVLFREASPGYFATMRIPIRRGREFTRTDLTTGTGVVVNETFAKAFWGGADPIGRSVTLHKAVQGRSDFGEPMSGTVVGLVGDVRNEGLASPAAAEVYVPYPRNPWSYVTLVVRVTGRLATVASALHRGVQEVDPGLALEGNDPFSQGFRPVDELLADDLAPSRLNMMSVGLFGLFALLLAALGIYGLIAYSVAQRTRELGVRVALGAADADVLRLIVGEAMRLAGIGIAVGLAGAVALTRVLTGVLYGVGATDPPTFAAVALLLTGVALLASYLPARRAAQVDPMVALRAE